MLRLYDSAQPQEKISPVMCRKRGDSRPESLDLGTPPSLSSQSTERSCSSSQYDTWYGHRTAQEVCDYCLERSPSPRVAPQVPQSMMRISEIVGAPGALHDRFDRWTDCRGPDLEIAMSHCIHA